MPGKPKNEAEVGEDLVNIFGEEIGQEKLFGEWCRIGLFLSNRKDVLTELRRLASDIQAEVIERDRLQRVDSAPKLFQGLADKFTQSTGLGSNPTQLAKDHFQYHHARSTHYRDLRPKRMPSEEYSELDKDKQHAYQAKLFSDYFQSDEVTKKIHGKVLDTCLRKSENTQGFVAGRAYYHGFVNPPAFMQEIAEKKQWKDPGALPVHGEHTHRIQWYCIGRALYGEEPQATAASYKSIGESFAKYRYEKEDAVTTNGQKITLTLWDALCDRTCIKQVAFATEAFRTFDADPENFGEDFRSPENLNMILTNQSNHKLTPEEKGEDEMILLLQASLLGRFEKRVYYAADAMRIDSHEYLSKKQFKVPYNQLNAKQSQIIDGLVRANPPIWPK